MRKRKPLVTILYEDSKIGTRFPLHDLVLRMLLDDVNGQRWKLDPLIDGIPKKSVDKVLDDLPRASTIAGAGIVFALIDHDKIIEHLNRRFERLGRPKVPRNAAVDDIREAVLTLSDDRRRVQVFFLHENVEDLLRDANACAPPRSLPDIGLALQKKLTARDSVFQELAKEAQHAVRKCIRVKQPDLDALITELAAAVPHEAAA